VHQTFGSKVHADLLGKIVENVSPKLLMHWGHCFGG